MPQTTALIDLETARDAVALGHVLGEARRRREVLEQCLELRAIVEDEDACEWDEIVVEMTDEIRTTLTAKAAAEIADLEGKIRALGFEPPAPLPDPAPAEDGEEAEAAA